MGISLCKIIGSFCKRNSFAKIGNYVSSMIIEQPICNNEYVEKDLPSPFCGLPATGRRYRGSTQSQQQSIFLTLTIIKTSFRVTSTKHFSQYFHNRQHYISKPTFEFQTLKLS